VIPVEAVAVVLWVAFVFVGVSREFPRELGATIGFVTMMLVLDLAGERAGSLAQRALQMGGIPTELAAVKWVIVTLIIGLTVVFMYQGEGLVYGGLTPPGILGTFFNLAVGTLNGWLVVGTWWYYTDELGYPIQRWGLYEPPLSALGQKLVAAAPMAVIPDERSWMFLIGFLVFLLVLKVAR
jgi:hypothetical protein